MLDYELLKQKEIFKVAIESSIFYRLVVTA